MKIKSKNPKLASMKLNVPVDGQISIDAKGIADVSAKCAVILVTGTNDWEYLTKRAEVVEDEDEDEEVEETERERFEAHLKTLKLEELKSLAEEGEMPREEWEKLGSKKLMMAYLLKKYDEAEANGEIEDEDEEVEETEE